jgi:hypothetical protein
LLSTISGGLENGCHIDDFYHPGPTESPEGDGYDGPWIH